MLVCALLLPLIQATLVSYHVLCLFYISRGMGAGQHSPALPSCMRSSILLADLCWPKHRSPSSVQSVSFWPWWPSSLAGLTVLTLWYTLYSLSPSVHHELAAGASIWNRPIWDGGEICQIAQYFATEPGTRSMCPAVMNPACSSSPGRNLAQHKSLLSISTLSYMLKLEGKRDDTIHSKTKKVSKSKS